MTATRPLALNYNEHQKFRGDPGNSFQMRAFLGCFDITLPGLCVNWSACGQVGHMCVTSMISFYEGHKRWTLNKFFGSMLAKRSNWSYIIGLLTLHFTNTKHENVKKKNYLVWVENAQQSEVKQYEWLFFVWFFPIIVTFTGTETSGLKYVRIAILPARNCCPAQVIGVWRPSRSGPIVGNH